MQFPQRQLIVVVVTTMILTFSGCISHSRIIPKSYPTELVMSATLDQLVKQLKNQSDAIQTITSSVEMSAISIDPRRPGVETETMSVSGFIFLRKPNNLNVILRVPVVGSQALNMVSIGCKWQLWIPFEKRAMDGTCEIDTSSEKGLYALRPAVFLDSLLIREPGPNEQTSLTSDSRLIGTGHKKDGLIEEPDYDLEIASPTNKQTFHTLRVVHFSRIDLHPFQQDIYDASGNIVTRAFYSNYQKYGEIWFPSKIVIKRPLDQYGLNITITKLSFNRSLADDQFQDLKIPDTVKVIHMK